jgi:hypothetical protein
MYSKLCEAARPEVLTVVIPCPKFEPYLAAAFRIARSIAHGELSLILGVAEFNVDDAPGVGQADQDALAGDLN